MGIYVNIEGFFKDRYWSGWWFDRSCFYEHQFDEDCKQCETGLWNYTAPGKTGLKNGEVMTDQLVPSDKAKRYHKGVWVDVKKK